MRTPRLTAGLSSFPKNQTFRLRKHCGQALVELAFVVPTLMLLALGVIEIGRYAYVDILVGNAARAGADYGAQSHAQSTDTTGIKNAALYDFAGATSGTTNTNGLAAGTLNVSSIVSCGCENGGTITSFGCDSTLNPNAGKCATGNWVVFVQVTASGSFNSLFNYPGIPSQLVVTKTASVPVA